MNRTKDILTIIVPYRDREEHLKKFIHQITTRFTCRLVIVEQGDDKPFNRGKLLNIGFLEFPGSDYYCFHDVDMLPISPFTYQHTPYLSAVQLAASDIQQKDYLGGVTLFHRPAFEWANGYPNNFQRGEDNALFFGMHKRGVPFINNFQTFTKLDHARPAVEFDPEAWRRAQHRTPETNGLFQCDYRVVATYITHTPRVHKIRVVT